MPVDNSPQHSDTTTRLEELPSHPDVTPSPGDSGSKAPNSPSQPPSCADGPSTKFNDKIEQPEHAEGRGIAPAAKVQVSTASSFPRAITPAEEGCEQNSPNASDHSDKRSSPGRVSRDMSSEQPLKNHNDGSDSIRAQDRDPEPEGGPLAHPSEPPPHPGGDNAEETAAQTEDVRPEEEIKLPDLRELICLPLNVYTDEEKRKAWDKASKTVEDFSNELIDQWNKEIDGLLTFAGLFSAILTAFNVQSYPLLQPAAADQTNMILIRMSSQLESFRLSSSFANSTHLSFADDPPPPFKAPLYAIWLNALWFTSLVFSLASATIGIIVKQWLKEYNSGLFGSSRDVARRRQYRYNNLEKWHTDKIVALVPVLLLIAAVLFLAGLLVLLHNINNVVAEVVSVFVGLLLLFVIITTVLPALSRSCCFYSPQSRALFFLRNLLVYKAPSSVGHAFRILVETFKLSIKPSTWAVSNPFRLLQLPPSPSYWRPFVPYAVAMASLLPILLACALYNPYLWGYKHLYEKIASLHRGIPRMWKAGEEMLSDPAQTVKLDIGIMTTAYSATLDVTSLDNSMICLTDGTSDDLWTGYAAKLKTLLDRYGPLENQWPELIQDQFVKIKDNVLRLSLALKFKDEQSDETSLASLNDPLMAVKKQLDLSGISHDERTRLRVLSTMHDGTDDNTDEDDMVWLSLFYSSDIVRIRDPATYRTVAAVIAHRLRSFLQAPHSQEDVGWKLKHAIYRPFSILQELLLENPMNSEDELAAIRPFATDALRTTQKILDTMNWDDQERDVGFESMYYHGMLMLVERLQGSTLGSSLVTSPLVATLVTAFSCLIGEDDWEHTNSSDSDVRSCRDIFVRLCSRFSLSTSGKRQKQIVRRKPTP